MTPTDSDTKKIADECVKKVENKSRDEKHKDDYTEEKAKGTCIDNGKESTKMQNEEDTCNAKDANEEDHNDLKTNEDKIKNKEETGQKQKIDNVEETTGKNVENLVKPKKMTVDEIKGETVAQKDFRSEGKVFETGVFTTKPSEAVEKEVFESKEEVKSAIFSAKCVLYRYKPETKEYVSLGSTMLYITKAVETDLFKVMGVRINANRLGCNHYLISREKITKHGTPNTWVWTTSTNSGEEGSKLGPNQMFCAKFTNEEDFKRFGFEHGVACKANDLVLSKKASNKGDL